MATSHLDLGRWAELTAQGHFLRRGWSVYASVSHHVPFDLIAVRKRDTAYHTALVEVRYLAIDVGALKRSKMLSGISACCATADLSHQQQLHQGPVPAGSYQRVDQSLEMGQKAGESILVSRCRLLSTKEAL